MFPHFSVTFVLYVCLMWSVLWIVVCGILLYNTLETFLFLCDFTEPPNGPK